jgi:hypothetical protein
MFLEPTCQQPKQRGGYSLPSKCGRDKEVLHFAGAAVASRQVSCDIADYRIARKRDVPHPWEKRLLWMVPAVKVGRHA